MSCLATHVEQLERWLRTLLPGSRGWRDVRVVEDAASTGEGRVAGIPRGVDRRAERP
jgi:hypothetical protein